MVLKKITLEGDSKYEKNNEIFPIRWKTHHVTELFMELCPKMELDGNGQLTILATRSRRENANKYNNYKTFHTSSYYLEEQIKVLENSKSEESEKYILDIIEKVLIDVIDISNKDEGKIDIVKSVTRQIVDNNFSLKQRVKTLSKQSKGGKYKAEVFRCLDKKLGEAWCVEIQYRDSNQKKIEWLTDKPDYLDRRDYFKKAIWEDSKFIITNKLGVQVASVNLDS